MRSNVTHTRAGAPYPPIRAVLVAVTLALYVGGSQAAFPAGTKVRRIDATKVIEMLRDGKRVVLLDVRSGGTSDHIPGALHVPLDRLDSWAESAPRDSTIVAYCA